MTSFNEVVTTFLIIRHGSTALVGKALAGRLPGVSLDARGREQAQELAVRLGDREIAAIYSSPLERAIQTAEPLAQRLEQAIAIRENLTEIGFGSWTGKALSELEGGAGWVRFNTQRGWTKAPEGELMLQVQARMAEEFEYIRQRHAGQTVAVFSHADVIKAALMLYLAIPLEHHLRLEISPASVSILELAEWGPRVLAVNS